MRKFVLSYILISVFFIMKIVIEPRVDFLRYFRTSTLLQNRETPCQYTTMKTSKKKLNQTYYIYLKELCRYEWPELVYYEKKKKKI